MVFIVFLITLPQLVASFYIVFVRLSSAHVGAISYSLLPSFSPQSIPLSAECLALVTNPTSDIYIDHLFTDNRALQIIQFSLSLLVLLPLLFVAQAAHTFRL